MPELMMKIAANRTIPDWLIVYVIAPPFIVFLSYIVANDLWLKISAWLEQRRDDHEKK